MKENIIKKIELFCGKPQKKRKGKSVPFSIRTKFPDKPKPKAVKVSILVEAKRFEFEGEVTGDPLRAIGKKLNAWLRKHGFASYVLTHKLEKGKDGWILFVRRAVPGKERRIIKPRQNARLETYQEKRDGGSFGYVVPSEGIKERD